MNIKSLFDPIDNVIAQARNFIHEQDVRKKYLKQIDEKIAIIQPELVKRKAELIELLQKIEADDQFKQRMEESLEQINKYLDHIELIAEKELALEIVKAEHNENDDSKKEIYIKKLSSLLSPDNNVVILTTTSESIVLRPSKIVSILVTEDEILKPEVEETKEKIEEPKEVEEDIITDKE